jgi:2-polyprenyl-3-methyl-5-hydroxy-6-metoxy-1,4-benzoquinol methylase
MRRCWCGSDDFAPFNEDYGVCRACGTLVSRKSLSDVQLQVIDDETDFYGKQYWLGHQAEDLGFPDIRARARHDLTERNLHWLRVLLKFKLPPASVMEIGCAHGSFVALLDESGFDARGVEMSPWVVAFGRDTFGVRIDVGPVESLDIARGSLDVIALMDVLEHLPDPSATMSHCLDLLKPDGMLLIQTPQFRTGMEFGDLVATNGAFLAQLKADEHLYLFTEESLRKLFSGLGAMHVRFEPAIFAQYDMFAVVSRTLLVPVPERERLTALMASREGRIVLALLDLREREIDVSEREAAANADRIERGAQVVQLTHLVGTCEADRADRGRQIEELTRLIGICETDRAGRATQVEELTRLLVACEADRADRGRQVEELTKLVHSCEAERAHHINQIEELNRLIHACEADRADRGGQIEQLTRLVHTCEADRANRGAQILELTRLIAEREHPAGAVEKSSQSDREVSAPGTGIGRPDD